jgi:hypothetical protein
VTRRWRVLPLLAMLADGLFRSSRCCSFRCDFDTVSMRSTPLLIAVVVTGKFSTQRDATRVGKAFMD